jgi:hypothetical protein
MAQAFGRHAQVVGATVHRAVFAMRARRFRRQFQMLGFELQVARQLTGGLIGDAVL